MTINHSDVTWIGTHLGITNEKGGLEESQLQHHTVVNVAEEGRNPSADIFAPLSLFSIKKSSLIKLTDVINERIKSDNPKNKIVIHDELGTERCGLVAAWLVHTFNSISLDEAYELVIQKRPSVVNYLKWIEWD
jgi:protein-tyrosine phosphatase